MGLRWILFLHPCLFDNSNLLSAAISASIIAGAPAGISAGTLLFWGEINVACSGEGK